MLQKIIDCLKYIFLRIFCCCCCRKPKVIDRRISQSVQASPEVVSREAQATEKDIDYACYNYPDADSDGSTTTYPETVMTETEAQAIREEIKNRCCEIPDSVYIHRRRFLRDNPRDNPRDSGLTII